MDGKDPPPFGYTFTADFFGVSNDESVHSGPSLLSEMERQQLDDFFSQGPLIAEQSSFNPSQNTSLAGEDLVNLEAFRPPTIHGFTTNIPDEPYHFHFENPQPPGIHTANFLHATPDDIQAASTLYSNAHGPDPLSPPPPPPPQQHQFHHYPHYPPQNQSGSYNYHPSHSSVTLPMSPLANYNENSMSSLQTPRSLLPDSLAAQLPDHDGSNSFHADLVTEFANSEPIQRQAEHMRQREMRRVSAQRQYSYGTDRAFNESGFQVSSPTETEEHVTRRLLSNVHHAQEQSLQAAAARDEAGAASTPILPGGMVEIPSEDGAESDEVSSDEDEDQPSPKRRRTSKSGPNGKANGSVRKSVSSGRSGKKGKAGSDSASSRKKRGSAARPKTPRQNLTDDQKRNNHIKSEQRRRDQIKEGYEMLTQLTPGLQAGTPSRSSILIEAHKFLQKLRDDNTRYRELLKEAEG